MKIQFDIDMIRRYDKAGPRYTSYPTAVAFNESFAEPDYCEQARASHRTDSVAPLSLYFHIPFCDTVCYYCACNKVVTKNRARAVEYLEFLNQEIEMQAALFDTGRRVEQLHWGGGTPTFLNHEQIRALMAHIGRNFTLLDSDSRDYSIEIDPRSVTPDTIGLLSQCGFNRFSLGVQDVDPAVQQAVNRIQPIEQTLSAIENCRRVNAKSVSVDLIYGLPLQTVDGFSNTLDTIIDISPDRISLFNYAHLPALFKVQKQISESELPSAQGKLDILRNSIDQLTNAGYLYIGMDHFARPDDELSLAQSAGHLHRNFQGYTTHAGCDLIAMGVSAISSVHGSYSQNEKNLDNYYQRLRNGRLPVAKGLVLTEDDKLRRHIIQQVSCHFSLDFGSIDRLFDIDFAEAFSTELTELTSLADDGLLTLRPDGFTVTPAGRMLVRTICMVFDNHLRNQTAKRFSRVI